VAQTTLPAPRTQVAPRRRAFFGLFDADGWGWASVKAIFWFVTIIMLLGYLPDRAYYFTVQRTVDLGLLVWSPINFCPPTNETLPCPAPAGAAVPWHPSPPEIQLPAGRTDGVAAVVGRAYIFAGGSDGKTAVSDVHVTYAVGTGNIASWTDGPALPEARSSAAGVVVGNTLYVMGGYGPDGKPTSTVFSATVGNDGTVGAWKTEATLVLPAPRAGASAVAVSDGIVLMGGTDGTAATKTVWKSQTGGTSGALGKWVAQAPMFEENVDGVAVHVGDYVYVMGGRNATGQAVATVQEGLLGGPNAVPADPNVINAWRVSAQTNLPGPRTNMSGFTANGTIYLQGGSDGSGPRTETVWTAPDSNGVIAAWQHLPQTDLGQGIEGAAGIASGAYGFTFGGQTAGGLTGGAARANLAPQQPFFQLGILGATIPGLKLDGEIGQQIGYLNAALVGTVDFVLLLLVGWGFAHKERVREIIAERRRRRG
jgi:hypothetical protein